LIAADPDLQKELKLLGETLAALDNAMLSPAMIHSARNESGKIEA
jgi:hypothetical protein